MAEISQSMPQFQYPDLLGSYLRGISAPAQLQAQQQQLQAGALNIDQLRLAVGNQQMFQDVARGALQRDGYLSGPPPGASSGPLSGGAISGAESLARVGPTSLRDPTPPGSFETLPSAAPASHIAPPGPGIQNGPQAAMGAGDQGQGGLQLGSPQGGLGGLMFSPGTASALALAKGQDPTAAYMENIGAQQKLKAMQMQGPLNLAESVISNPNADGMVRQNPSLLAGWQQYAPRLGLKLNPNDPTDPSVLTPYNARRAAYLWKSDMLSQLGQSAGPMPSPPDTTRTLADGTILQTKGMSGEITAPYKPELKETVGPGGQPQYMPGPQAAGKEPFNATLYAGDLLTPQALQTASQTYRTTGALPANFQRNPIASAKAYNQIASDLTASGDTVGAINARTAAFAANKEALEQVTKLQTSTSGYANTLHKNLDSLLALQGKTDTSGVPLLNKVYRAWQQGVSGDPDIAKYVTYLSSAQGEFAKLKSGSLGNAPATDSAMKDAADTINKFMSSGQIAGAAEAMKGEAANRIGAIQEQVNSVKTQLGVNAPTAAAPKQNSALPPTNAQGWTLHRDAAGRQAYVSPDRKQFEAVQ